MSHFSIVPLSEVVCLEDEMSKGPERECLFDFLVVLEMFRSLLIMRFAKEQFQVFNECPLPSTSLLL